MMKDNIIAKLYKKFLGRTSNNESMSKAPHNKNVGENAADCDYDRWLNEHPSALSSFESIINAAKGKKIVMFLDYDGTLSPIVADPDRAFMSDLMRSAVREVAKQFPTAIISGRSRDKVYEFVKLDELYYAGSHGMDIVGPPLQPKSFDDKYSTRVFDKKGNELTIFQPAQDYLPAIKEILNELENETSQIKGVQLENNRFCVSVHYRHVSDEGYVILEKKVDSILRSYPDFHWTKGKKVMEIRPKVKWNKGEALKYLLHTLGFANNSDALPVYIGDDRTDEDAFKVLKERGQGNGYPIIVSSMPRETMAAYSLCNTSEVLSFLLRLAGWKSENSSW